jgi:predicted thioesterase
MSEQLAKVIKGEVFIYGADHLAPAAKVGNVEIAKALERYNGKKVKITIETED